MRLHPLVIPAVFTLGACAVQPPQAAPRPLGGGTVRVATWNVHDLFDAVDRLVPPGELDAVPAPEEVAAKLDRVANVLRRLDADLLLLQEVETMELAEALAVRAGYAAVLLVEGFDPRGIDVAVLSRLPVERYVSHLGELAADGTPLWSRDCVELHAAAGERRLVLVGTHLVSRLTDLSGARRLEQAARLREIADAAAARDPDALVVAGGDLNDTPGSASLAPLLGDGAWRDPLAEAGLEEIWTWAGLGGGARLDYLLLLRGQAWRAVSVAVLDGEDVLEASDHRPVVLDLTSGR